MLPNIKLAIVAGVLAVIAAIGGVLAFVASTDETVMCNGKKSDGFSCAVYNDGRITLTKYDDLKAQQQSQKRGFGILGGSIAVFFAGLGTVLLISGRRQARREAVTASSWSEPTA